MAKNFILHFIVPYLIANEFPHCLNWEDISKKIFRIYWPHQSGSYFTAESKRFFQIYDKFQGHDNDGERASITAAKSRVRNALNKAVKDRRIEELPTTTPNIKRFKILFKLDQNQEANMDLMLSNSLSSNFYDPRISPPHSCSSTDSGQRSPNLPEHENSINLRQPVTGINLNYQTTNGLLCNSCPTLTSESPTLTTPVNCPNLISPGIGLPQSPSILSPQNNQHISAHMVSQFTLDTLIAIQNILSRLQPSVSRNLQSSPVTTNCDAIEINLEASENLEANDTVNPQLPGLADIENPLYPDSEYDWELFPDLKM